MRAKHSNVKVLRLTPILILLALCSCYSVERTPVIRLSKEDLTSERTVSNEDRLMEQLSFEELSRWRRGKPFLPVLERASMLFPTAPESVDFRTLYFQRVDSTMLPDGRHQLNIHFADSAGNKFVYEHRGNSSGTFSSNSIPMLVDLDIVHRADSILRGRHLWPRNVNWLNPKDMTTLKSRRFVEVTTDSVGPGNEYFPCCIYFTDQTGRQGCFLFDPTPSSSRSFSSQFFIADPRPNYSQILDQRWDEICRGQISEGMTKEEARLALGAPQAVNRFPDYARLIEIWTYSDGVYLRFEDGLLVQFRK